METVSSWWQGLLGAVFMLGVIGYAIYRIYRKGKGGAADAIRDSVDKHK